ncbi:hypothetical protein, variant 2 [Aphanomyces astaci]|uniref:Uncharacterized protein n=1 Tax=Aphanomyces astaci TaxID=112090 RepID=W4GFL5_APHAT|nr:hypothetical protein, variant 2 [Aphanomyces astaci]ETV78465.1 hypothetical protein, variant 2 [Aphanomyces astaci]|eukprot:XP_009832044.1 hypothetical protein, variant 2 [Aphanomyces astaci]
MGIAEEEAELSREMVQFLTNDVISQLRTTQSQLEDAERRWSRMETQEEATGKSMKAKVKIDGHLVTEADIEVNLRRGYLVNSKLHQACVLDQLLEFHRALQLQYRRMENIVRLLEKQVSSIQDAGDGRLLQHTSSLVAQVVTELGSMCRDLRTGGNAVRLPSTRRFPYCSQLDHVSLDLHQVVPCYDVALCAGLAKRYAHRYVCAPSATGTRCDGHVEFMHLVM